MVYGGLKQILKGLEGVPMPDFQVIREGDLFWVADARGDAPSPSLDPFGFGLYTRDTRVLSTLRWESGFIPFELLCGDALDGHSATYRFTNAPFRLPGGGLAQRDTLAVTRRQTIGMDGLLREVCECENYGNEPVEIEVDYEVSADFLDMFEVRGHFFGQYSKTIWISESASMAEFRYVAADGVESRTGVFLWTEDAGEAESAEDGLEACLERPLSGGQPEGGSRREDVRGSASPVRLSARMTVRPRETRRWTVSVEPGFEAAEKRPSVPSSGRRMGWMRPGGAFSEAARQEERVRDSYSQWMADAPRVLAERDFTRWYERGLRDLRMLRADIGHGPFPVAGVPWFAVPFGRDSLIAAYQSLSAVPELARGAIETMAAWQGRDIRPDRDEEPGKIMHELRAGELTRTGAVPFGPYYGSIDATPLFLVLLAEYFAWSRDGAFLRRMLSVAEAAFEWMERFGDRDGDGFLEYHRESERGIANQGWKDSGDSMMHENGVLAAAPIAPCEVQGYAYRAYDLWSSLWRFAGDFKKSEHCASRSADLRSRFVKSFWMEDTETVALALDADRRPLRVASSNMGQVLWSGILPEELGGRVCERLVQDDLFTGFGIRTLSSREKAFNPMSYHNGSVWPHDNSLIVQGMQRYGRLKEASLVARGLLRAAWSFEGARLPELFGGYGTREARRPVPYRVSCSPQAWAAGSPLLVLRALLGLQPDLERPRMRVRPTRFLGSVLTEINGIPAGNGTFDVRVTASGDAVVATVGRNSTGFEIAVEPSDG